MHFSCKISNAILNYLESKGEDVSPLYDMSPIPWELLRDSSYWMSAPSMEQFMEAVQRVPTFRNNVNVYQAAGHNGPELHAWGVLDSVLRMMPRPHEIFNQPERFLSYFISPQPPTENLRQSETEISFDLPLPAEQYPLTTSYLKAAFESLPVYVGLGLAKCEWEGIRLKIQWPQAQENLFSQDPGHQISPELLQKVIEDLQHSQQDLEEKNKLLQKKNEELLIAQTVIGKSVTSDIGVANTSANAMPAENFHFSLNDPGYMIGQNLARLHDYMVRAQQLVTVLMSQSKLSQSAMKALLRRVDWDFVKAQYPRTISESVEVLRRMPRDGATVKYSLEDENNEIKNDEDLPLLKLATDSRSAKMMSSQNVQVSRVSSSPESL